MTRSVGVSSNRMSHVSNVAAVRSICTLVFVFTCNAYASRYVLSGKWQSVVASDPLTVCPTAMGTARATEQRLNTRMLAVADLVSTVAVIVTVPSPIPETRPELLTVASEGFEDTQLMVR